MNRRFRVLMVGRHFWPHGSLDPAGFLVQLATGLQRRGVDVEVVTPRFDSAWPQQFRFREIEVHRPVSAPRGEWSVGRYVRQLTSWLREHASTFDVFMSDSGREEAIAVVEAAQALQRRSIVRVGGHGEHSDLQWWKTSRAAKRCASCTKQCDRVISSTAATHRELLQAGFASSRISRVNTGFASEVAAANSSRRQARAALAAVNSDLRADDDALVVACVGPMTVGSGSELLSQSAYHLIARYPHLKLWFIGDGPRRDSLYEQMRSDGIRSSIAMPGSFSELDDVMAAADIYVQADLLGLDYLLPCAVSADLPAVVIDHESTRQLFSPPAEARDGSLADRVHWFHEAKPKALRTAIVETVSQLDSSREQAVLLRKSLLRCRPLDQVIEQYAQVIQQSAAWSAVRPTDASMGAVS